MSSASPLLKLRSDEQLVAHLRQGSQEAFRVIHDRYRQRLFAYIRQMLGSTSRQDAEDVLQDVFARAYTALRADRRSVHLRPWLYRVAHNRCIDYLRQTKPATTELFETAGKPLHDPFEDVQRREDLKRLVADIGRLPEQQRSALLMREMDGLSYRELAEALDVTVPAIKSLLVRARVELVETAEARSADCVTIQGELLESYDSKLKVSPHARRHIRDCAACTEYRGALGGMQKSFAALSPIAAVGPLALLGKLLGIGGSGSGASAGAGGAGAGGGSLVAGLTATTAGKVAVVATTAAITAGGAVGIERRVGDDSDSSAVPATAAGGQSRTGGLLSPSAPAGLATGAGGGAQAGANPVAVGSRQGADPRAGATRSASTALPPGVSAFSPFGAVAPGAAATQPVPGSGGSPSAGGSAPGGQGGSDGGAGGGIGNGTIDAGGDDRPAATVPGRTNPVTRPERGDRPGTNELPRVTERPRLPDRPKAPDNPRRPDTPASSEDSGRADTPKPPDASKRPEVPARPNLPTRPNLPERSDGPGRPEKPGKGGTPDPVDRPEVEKPRVDKPEVEKPRVDKPEIEKPKVDKIEKPKVEKPKPEVEKPKPAVEKPKVEKPKGEQPKVEKPKVEQPRVEKPKVDRPDRAPNRPVDPPVVPQGEKPKVDRPDRAPNRPVDPPVVPQGKKPTPARPETPAAPSVDRVVGPGQGDSQADKARGPKPPKAPRPDGPGLPG